MRIFLIGFMGSGKSFTGKQLAGRLGWPFIDLDDWIEAKAQMSIKQIFSALGEAAFREKEKQALQDMIDFEDVIIACGGGTPCFFDNLAWMNRHGYSIYLKTSVDVLIERLLPETADRPLIKDLDKKALRAFIDKKLREREKYYLQASLIISQKEVEWDTAGVILDKLGKIPDR